jgi:hypothetical protein
MSLENIAPETRDEMAALLKKLSDHPKTRKTILKSIKEVDPEFHIPELEIESKAEEVYSKTNEELEKLRAELRERDAREELSKRRNSLMKNGKIKSEEEIAEIEKIMVDKKIADHEAAADYWNWMKQASEPTPSGYNPQVMKQWDLTKYMKNPQAAAREAAADALNELRRNPRPVGL